MTGLEILRNPDTTAEQIADIIAEHCPPVTHEHCDKLPCRECWLAWLTKVETDGEQSEKQTTPYRPLDKANEWRFQHTGKKLHQCPPMRELRSLLEDWQRKNAAPYSALKICFSAFLAAEEKNISATHPPLQDRKA